MSYSNLEACKPLRLLQLNDEGPGEELDENEGIASFQDWILPAKEFDGLWERYIMACFEPTLLKMLLM